MKAQEQADALGSGCLLLFAAPFALAGAAILYQGLLHPAEQKEPLWVVFVAGLLFFGVGVGLGIFAVVSGRGAKSERALRERFPDQPWKWRPEWEAGRIPSDSRSTLFAAWAISLFWNGVTSLGVAAGWRDVRDEPWRPILLLFPLVGVALLYWALKETARYFRHGTAWFEMDRPPGVIGGRLRGTVRTRIAQAPRDGFEVSLHALRVTHGSDSSSEHLLWQTERKVSIGELGRQAGAVVVPVNFEIPPNAEPTDESDGGRIRWRLHVNAALPGLDYAADFPVPVFRVPGREESHAAAHTFAEPPQPAGAPPYLERVRPDGIVEYYFPAGRSPEAAGAMTIMLLLWMGVLAGMLWFEIPWIFIAVWALFDLLLTWAALELWFSATQTWFDGEVVAVRRTLFGWGRVRRLRAAEIQRVSVDIGMSQGRTMTQKARAWYDVNLHAAGGRKFTVGGAMRDRIHAERFAQLLRRRVEQFANRAGLHIGN